MSNSEKPELFSLLKKLGFQLEGKVNKYIQDQLNKEEVALTANTAGHVLAHLIEAIHDYVEQLSSQLNFPTKRDVGRLGKLIVQSEDKLDNVEEELHEVLNLVKELKMMILKDVKDIPTPLEGLETTIKNRVLPYKEKLAAKSNTNTLKEELQRELMKPPGQVDLKEINKKLLSRLQEKQTNKWGN
ncbi:hypothetical protein [Bacillus sp. J37]|uniref:hypothetical protein n=1 Tax=Bacillus sp. J37 TaxID=935837 RepID=UPI00047D910F|nr:hypothetical protein [Bacillus sp. J37]